MKIEAFFRGIKNANEAASKLKSEGIEAFTDINDHYQTGSSVRHPGFIPTSSNSDLVVNSGLRGGEADSSPLRAASPMVSGMGGFKEITNVNYKVIVNTDENNEKKAQDIISSLGGSMESPNFDGSRHIKDVDFSKADPNFMKNLQ
ncbi:hypothetical protein NL50_04575 [Clostridium acetobutylicum]|nr:hypothetical protein NL50_04575 [Clostridium acetobutylicum]